MKNVSNVLIESDKVEDSSLLLELVVLVDVKEVKLLLIFLELFMNFFASSGGIAIKAVKILLIQLIKVFWLPMDCEILFDDFSRESLWAAIRLLTEWRIFNLALLELVTRVSKSFEAG